MVQDPDSDDLARAPSRMLLDLSLVVVYTILAYAVILHSMVGNMPSTIVGAGFVLFVPGYAFIAALFPERPDPSIDHAGLDLSPDGGRIDLMERVALSFVASFLVVTVLSFLLDVSQVGIQPEPFIRGLSVFTLVATTIAGVRRLALPAEQRFGFPIGSWIPARRGTVWSPEDSLNMTMHAIVISALIVGLLSAGYAVSVPQSGETFTEFYVLSEDDDGELIAGEYPTAVVEGEPQNLVVGVSNQEHQSENYSLIVRLQRVESNNESSSVLEEQVITRQEIGQLAHNESTHQRIEFSPELAGEHIRLQLLLFRGSPPETPSPDDAYRDLHLWMTVAPAENQSMAQADSRNTDYRSATTDR